MHHHHHGHHRRRHSRRFPSRLELLAQLEERQRDLEQELADIADVISHLRDVSDAHAEQQQ